MAAYFIIGVTNNGGYVARASVSYVENGQQYKQNSGDFTAGVKKTFQLPGDATNILLDVDDEYFISSWRNIFTQQWAAPPADQVCFDVAGTTLLPTWKQVNC